MVILRCKSRRDCLWDVGTGNTAVKCHMVKLERVPSSTVGRVAQWGTCGAATYDEVGVLALFALASTALRFDLVMV